MQASDLRNRKSILSRLVFPALCTIALFSTIPANGENLKETAAYRLENGRFYSVTAVDMDGDGEEEIIAAGQVSRDSQVLGYIAVLKVKEKKGRFDRLGDEEFAVEQNDLQRPTRVRSLAVVRNRSTGKWEIFTSGKGGDDLTGVGFLRKSVYHDGSFRESDAEMRYFAVKGKAYTHGYPLEAADLDGNGRPDIVYGGFSGKEERDRADIRIAHTDKRGRLRLAPVKPFADLSVPLRVNALAVEDLDGNGKKEIIIAGRTRTKKGQHASFAAHRAGRTIFQAYEGETASRLRCLLTADLDADGVTEIVTGGRLDSGGSSEARLDVWHLQKDAFVLKSRYRWTGDGSTRVRALKRLGKGPSFIAAGRTEVRNEGGLFWQGFLRRFSFDDGMLLPAGKPVMLEKGWETRIRAVTIWNHRHLLAAGFTKDEAGNTTGELFIATPARPFK
jgi:hypothetical protein